MLKNLRQLREEAGISQRQLAEAIGVSQQSINKYENHKIEPDIHTMIRISDYFHTSVDFLIGHTSIRQPADCSLISELSEEENLILLGYRKLSSKKKSSIHQIIENYNE